MDVALNHPEHGYYARGPERLGRGGDFFTAADVGPAFGRCVARWLVEMDVLLGKPRPFRYVEHGAGRGHLAKDVLDALATEAPELLARSSVVLVDTSTAMRAAAELRVPMAKVLAGGTRGGGGPGCVVAVELFDALPVHRLRRRGAALREVMVGLKDDRLVEIEGEPTPAVIAWAERYGAPAEDGDEGEACPALGPTLTALAASIDRGYVLIVDYGHEAERLFGPAHRRGTLMAYHRHTASEDYLERVGEQDLTAHVNLTALRGCAVSIGLRVVTITTQSRFLLDHGILDGLDSDEPDALTATKRRLQAKQLIHPLGMGATFKVAVLAKGL